MTLTVGRIGLPWYYGGDDLLLEEPDVVRSSARGLTLSGSFETDSRTDLLARMDQFASLVGASTDEPIVPVTSTMNPEVDGYYRALDATGDFRGAGSLGGAMAWSVDLERVADYRMPQVILQASWALLANAHSVTTYGQRMAVSSLRRDFAHPFPITVASTDYDVSDGAQVRQYAGTGSTAGSGAGRLIIPPAGYYHGGCRLGRLATPNGYRQVLGRGTFADGTFRLENGRTRLEFSITPGFGGSALQQSRWLEFAGDRWSSPHGHYIAATGGGVTALSFSGVSVLRNTPEMVVVRIAATPVGLKGTTFVDVGLRRGEVHYSIVLTSLMSDAWRIYPAVAAGHTVRTGGVLERTSSYDNAFPWVFGRLAQSVNTSTGAMTLNVAAPTAYWALGTGLASGFPDAAPVYHALDYRARIAAL